MGKMKMGEQLDLDAKTHPNASNAILPMEGLSILEPMDSGHGVACSWAAEFDRVPGRHCMQFLLHALGVCPVGCYREKSN